MSKETIRKDFLEAMDRGDKNTVSSLLQKIKQNPGEYIIHLISGQLEKYNSNSSRPSILQPLHPTLHNEDMHSYIKEFFDFAVRNYFEMPACGAGNRINFERIDGKSKESVYDGNIYIMEFLSDYVSVKRQFEKEGKEIFEPEVLNEYSFLRDYVEQVIHFQKFEEFASAAREKGNLVSQEEIQNLASMMLDVEQSSNKREKEGKRYISLGRYERAIDPWKSFIINNKKEDSELLIAVKEKMKDLKQSETYLLKIQNEEISQKLEKTQKRLEQTAQRVAEKEVQYEHERETSVNINEDLKGLTDEEKKQNFDKKKKLMEEHAIMLEACLNSMFTSYYLTEDKELKRDMLKDLYDIRKGGEKNKDKRDMAKTFKRVLDRNPSLKKDENLVALSKIDTPFAQPTKHVKKQVTR